MCVIGKDNEIKDSPYTCENIYTRVLYGVFVSRSLLLSCRILETNC